MANVAIAQNSPTFPVPDPGFNALSLFAFPSYGNLNGVEYLETHSFIVTVPSQLTPDEWDNFLQNEIAPNLAGQGLILEAYGIWENPVLNVSIPQTLCIGPLPCIDLTTICLPIVGCLGGKTLVSAFEYQVWVLTQQITPNAYRARGEVRGFVGLVIAAILILFGAALAIPLFILLMREVNTGKITSGQLFTDIKGVVPDPGQWVGTAFNPLITLGIVASITSVAIAFIAVSHGQPIPPAQPQGSYEAHITGPGGVGAGFGSGRR